MKRSIVEENPKLSQLIQDTMGKLGKRKRNHAQNEALTKKQAISGSKSEEIATPVNLSTVVAPEDVEITVETLETLASHPAIIKSKACKDLRTAVFSFRQATTTGLNAAEGQGLTARISAALTDAKYTDALILLAEMRIRGETPSLGALCRWVRQLDVVSGISTDGQNAVHSQSDAELLRMLDAILRVTGPVDTNLGMKASTGPISVRESWNLRRTSQPTRPTRRSVEDKSIFTTCPSDFRERFRILETTLGPQRKPPNLHPAVLFTSTDDAVHLGAAPQTTCHTHPIVPNLRLIENVLTPEECLSIIAAGETVEFIPDAPARPEGEDSSILAHNFYWMVDQPFHDKLWERVKPFVPESVHGNQVRGINRRFRVYRYVPGAEYRLHIGTSENIHTHLTHNY